MVEGALYYDPGSALSLPADALRDDLASSIGAEEALGADVAEPDASERDELRAALRIDAGAPARVVVDLDCAPT